MAMTARRPRTVLRLLICRGLNSAPVYPLRICRSSGSTRTGSISSRRTRWTHGISRPLLLAERQPNIQWLGSSGLGVLFSLVSDGPFHTWAVEALRSDESHGG